MSARNDSDNGVERRRFLAAVAGVAGLAALGQVPADRAIAAVRPRSGGYPFTLGVASGDPAPDGAVLWTRLAPEPLAPDGGMPAKRVPVQWQVATDDRMRRVIHAGTAVALPELAHSVHVELSGLEPGREYFYAFRYRDDASDIGRTKTAPPPGAHLDAMSFAFASCQRWDDGYYAPYRHLAMDDLDLVVHLGDYLYEYGINEHGGFRNVPVPDQFRTDTTTLDRYRIQYGLYKSDQNLQQAHARFPWLVTWDDHEVDNDYAGTVQGYSGADITARRAAAYQAFYEHLPLRRSSMPRDGDILLYRRLAYGDLAQFDVLDTRQYRSVPPCGWGEADECDAAYDPSVTMTGSAQERWLLDGLSVSTARWNVLANQVLMARLDHDGDEGDTVWNDAWDGYPAARQRIIDHIVQAGVRNPVVITGDWHSTFVNDINTDFTDPDSATVATEFVGTSISSNGDREVYGPYYGPMIKFNPHIKFFDGDRRGYVRCTVDQQHWRSDLQMVTTVSRPDAPAYTLASFVVEDGRPGAHEV
ncbi:MAG: alkaline phosphatase [Actinophytocola sp.]|nr:alkaline phosphatase [Actinophytocola sp.]